MDSLRMQIYVVFVLCMMLSTTTGSVGCSELILDSNGMVDISKTIYACGANMSDPEMIYSYKDSAGGLPLNLSVNIQINNLVEVDDASRTTVMDLVITQYWTDPRWNLSTFWDTRGGSATLEGITIDQLVFKKDRERLRLWLPDTQFVDQIDVKIIKQHVKLRKNGLLSWKKQLKLVVVQPQFHYQQFPLDTHDLILRFGSTAYSIDFLVLQFNDDDVGFIKAAYPNEHDINWELNYQWELKDDYSTHISHMVKNTSINSADLSAFQLDTATSADTDSSMNNIFVISSTFDVASVSLATERRSQGVLIRLGSPILVLMLLGGMVFWATKEKRIYATMTILYAVSTLYVVVFSNIPLLGYITNFDAFILTMFVILTLAVATHQFIYRISEKADRRPLRYIIVRFMEFLGRVSLIPAVVILFMNLFLESSILRSLYAPLVTVVAVVFSVITIRDFGGLRKTFMLTMLYYEERKEKGEMHSMSDFELKAFKFYVAYIKPHCINCDKKKIDAGQAEDDDCDSDEEYNRTNQVLMTKRGTTTSAVATYNTPMLENSHIHVTNKLKSCPHLQQYVVNTTETSDTTTGTVKKSKSILTKKFMKKQSLIDSISRNKVNAEKVRLSKISSVHTSLSPTEGDEGGEGSTGRCYGASRASVPTIVTTTANATATTRPPTSAMIRALQSPLPPKRGGRGRGSIHTTSTSIDPTTNPVFHGDVCSTATSTTDNTPDTTTTDTVLDEPIVCIEDPCLK